MKVIILCAGYAVRLYPLTQNTPKPLLPIGGRPMLEYLLEKIVGIKEVESVYLVTNGKFAPHFEAWRHRHADFKKNIVVVNDGTMTNETRLGAIGDLGLVLTKERILDDVLVVAGDNFFTFDLEGFVARARTHKPFATIGLYDVKDRTLAKNYGLVEVDRDGKITSFLEKPRVPRTTLASTGVYYFPQGAIGFLDRYIEEKNNPDAPGYFIQWLIRSSEVYGMILAGTWYDIGDLASYEKVNALMKR